MKRTCLFLLGIISLLVLAAPFRAAAQTTLISTGAVWKYLDNGSDQGAAWTATAFVDAGWSTGGAQFGYGEADETTVLAITNLSGTTSITFYFRHTFNLVSASSVTNLRARIKRDDGAIVYLNGTEVLRDNMPAGAVTFVTNATAAIADDGQTFNPFSIPAGLLVNGDNVIAVEVHQAGITSSDVSFDFDLIGNPQPSITINSPTNNQVVIGTSLAVSGVAVPGGSNVTLVEVYTNAVKLGESTNAAYSVVWGSAAPGAYTLTARVTDTSGLRATSAPVAITVQAPPAGLLVARGSVWKYHNLNTDLGTSWRTLAYDDTAWASGPGPLGGSDGGADTWIVTALNYGPSGARYPTIYYRRTFNVSSASAYGSLTLRLLRDDGAAVYLNGTLLVADGVATPTTFGAFATQTVDAANESTYFEYTVSASGLLEGANVLAVESKQVNATSSDLGFDLEVAGTIDTTAPVLAAVDPTQGSTVLDLNFVRVTFDDAVTGVNASDLLINNEQATNMAVVNTREYTFYFPRPTTGTVQVAFAPGHGITDTSPLGNAFAGGSWTYAYDPNASAAPTVIISEIMADNQGGIEDEDGTRSDWIEIYNLGPLDANLGGWFLSDITNNLAKWRFPSLSMPANSYLLVYASEKNRTNPAAPLHTNFKLSGGGGYLALVNPATNVVSAFAPYPGQDPNVSYGRAAGDPNTLGYFSSATPGAQNSTSGSGFAAPPTLSRESGLYPDSSLTLTVTPAPGTIARYTYDGSDPITSSPGFGTTANIAFSTNMMIKFRAYQTNVAGLLPSPIVSRTFVMLDTTTTNFTSDLPVVILSTHGLAIPANVVPGAVRRRGVFVSVDTFRGRSSLQGKIDHQGLAQFEIVGQTSAGFAWNGIPKPPYRVELNDEYGNDKRASILGMPSEADWNIRNPFADKCLMNDYLGYELWEDMGHYSCRRRQIELFVDNTGGKLVYPGDYYGVMTFFEHIERGEDRVDLAELTRSHTNEPSISGGYILKKDKDSTGDTSFTTTGGAGHSGQVIKFHDPKPRDISIVQSNWIRNYVQLFENAMYSASWTNASVMGTTNHYSHYVDIDAFVDQHIHVEFTKQIDGYRISSYYSKDRNGKLGPKPVWDWNLAFGNANYLQGSNPQGWYWSNEAEGMNSANHIWLHRMVFGAATGATTAMPSGTGSGDPEFRQRITDRWAVLRTNVFNGTRLTNRIQQIAAQLNESQGRNYSRYSGLLNSYTWPNPEGPAPIADYTKATYEEIITEMKNWTWGRYQWMDSQFLLAPTLSQPPGNVNPGTTVALTGPSGTTLMYTLDGTDPRLPGGGVAPGAFTYSGTPITINSNVRLVSRTRTNTLAYWTPWSASSEATYVISTPKLAITELMYHPAAAPVGSTNVDEDFEYVELKNTGVASINLQGFRLRGGLEVTLPNYLLAPGSYVVVVAQTNAFQARYGNTPVIVGSYTNRLQNSGEHVVLEGPVREPIHDFTYTDGWYDITDGFGFSLVPVNENAAPTNWVSSASWRPSAAYNGSPGTNDAAAPVFPQVVINEALTHSDLPLIDALELRNLGAGAADISHWYLTDDFNVPQKYRFPSNSIIAGGGYFVVYETNFNSGSNAFSLSSLGDAVYLFSGDAAGNLTGYQQGFDFGPQFNAVTFGRYLTSQGEDHFVAQSSSTLGSANSGPLVGPVVITEVNFHPPDVVNSYGVWDNTEDEFIELRNISGSVVPLHHPTNTTLVWALRDAVDYAFPPGTNLPAGGYALVVSFDPTNTAALNAFRSRNGVSAAIPVFGPFSGKLDNSSDSVELVRPDNPELGIMPLVRVDKVHYSHLDPWPAGADGLGFSLQRLVQSSYGNDPTNWTATVPSPGYALTGVGPVITAQPQNVTVLATMTASFSITATGAPPIGYQWYYNNTTPVSGATNSTLLLPNLQPSQSGLYRCLAINASGATFSSNAVLTVVVAASVTQQPTNIFLRVPPDPLANPTRVAVFALQATTQNPPLAYQWRRNGTNLPLNNINMTGVTSNVLTISNVVFSDAGYYSCDLTDGAGTVSSSQAVLGVVPFAMIPPAPQTIPAGGNINVGVGIQAYPPPYLFRWQRGNTALGIEYSTTSLTNFAVFGSTTNLFVLSAGSVSNSYEIRLVVTNLATTSAGLVLSNFPSFGPNVRNVFVLLDTDLDGIPNQIETNLFGMDTNNAADALGDLDGDGASNLDEFRAGTDPTNAASYLKVELTPLGGLAEVKFAALSNRLYTIQFTDTVSNMMPAAAWTRLVDMLSRPTNRVEAFIDPNWTSNRFYRVVTPRAP